MAIETNDSTEVESLKLSVGVMGNAFLLETEGLFTQGWRPGRNSGEPVGGMFELDSSDWTNGLRFDTIPSIPDPTLSLTECARLYEHSPRLLVIL